MKILYKGLCLSLYVCVIQSVQPSGVYTIDFIRRYSTQGHITRMLTTSNRTLCKTKKIKMHKPNHARFAK